MTWWQILGRKLKQGKSNNWCQVIGDRNQRQKMANLYRGPEQGFTEKMHLSTGLKEVMGRAIRISVQTALQNQALR